MGKIVCIGGLIGLKNESGKFISYNPREVDKEIIKLSSKKEPKVLFIGTASKERQDYFKSFKVAYEKLGAKVEQLLLINSKIDYCEIKKCVISRYHICRLWRY